jgi:hypothetical protein
MNQQISALLSVGHKKEEIDEAVVFIYGPIINNFQSLPNAILTQDTLPQQFKPKKKLTKEQKISLFVKFSGVLGIVLILFSASLFTYRILNKKEAKGDIVSGIVDNNKVSDYMTEIEKGMVKKGEYKIGKTTQMSDYNGVYTLSLDSVEATSLDLKFNVTVSFTPSSSYSYGYVSFYNTELRDNNGNVIPTSRGSDYYFYSESLTKSFYKDLTPKKGYITFTQTNIAADNFTLKIDDFAPVEGITLK